MRVADCQMRSKQLAGSWLEGQASWIPKAARVENVEEDDIIQMLDRDLEEAESVLTLDSRIQHLWSSHVSVITNSISPPPGSLSWWHGARLLGYSPTSVRREITTSPPLKHSQH